MCVRVFEKRENLRGCVFTTEFETEIDTAREFEFVGAIARDRAR